MEANSSGLNHPIHNQAVQAAWLMGALFNLTAVERTDKPPSLPNLNASKYHQDGHQEVHFEDFGFILAQTIYLDVQVRFDLHDVFVTTQDHLKKDEG